MDGTNRLPADAPHGFGGALLDRSKPLSFLLDGRSIPAFAGDTVLSALLANGMDVAGTHNGLPIGVDERSAPLVVRRGEAHLSMPMDRVPALSGLDLVTAGAQGEPARGMLGKLLLGLGGKRGPAALPLDDRPVAPWLERAPDAILETDTLIIGGGLAGLAAAAAATGRTILVERRPWLGGDARYFGTTGDEEPPEAAIARLSKALSADILLLTEVFALNGTIARAHQVRIENGVPSARIVEIRAAKAILASGSFERLPLFPGNRLPGNVGAIAAFHRAERHGVWLGRRALFSTPGSHGYRLALLAHDAGIKVQLLADSRLGANSRFIDFCKASGVPFTTGLVPRAATQIKGQPGLSVGFAVAIDDIAQQTGLTETDQFVAGGGLQPDLSLWLQAGGKAHWANDRLEALGAVPGVNLAGSVAGYRSSTACIASGRMAATGKAAPINDAAIEAIYETPDVPTPVAPPDDGRIPSYLDRGSGLATRPADPAAFARPVALGLGELAAAVQIGAVPAAVAGEVAVERVIVGGDIVDTGWRVPASPAATELPAYLGGRFGSKPQLCVVTSADARYFERGCLVFAGSAITDPALAIGCIVAPAPNRGIGGLALIEREASKGTTQLFVRDAGGAVPIERIERVKPS